MCSIADDMRAFFAAVFPEQLLAHQTSQEDYKKIVIQFPNNDLLCDERREMLLINFDCSFVVLHAQSLIPEMMFETRRMLLSHESRELITACLDNLLRDLLHDVFD